MNVVLFFISLGGCICALILSFTEPLVSLDPSKFDLISTWLSSNVIDGLVLLAASNLAFAAAGVFATSPDPDVLIAEDLFEEREHFVRELTNTIPDIVYVYDLDLGKLVYLNDRVRKLLGYEPSELMEFRNGLVETFLHSEDNAAAPQWFKKVNDLQRGEILEHKFRVRHKLGEWRWLESREVVLKRDGSGRAVQIMAVANDITERVNIEQTLKESRERNASILKALPDLIFIQDAQGNFLDYHARDPKVLFAPPSEFLGKNMREVIPPNILKPLTERFEAAKHSEEPQGFEYETSIAGIDRAYECRIVKCGADKVLSIVRDITDQKRMGDALHRSEQFSRAVIESSKDSITIVDLKGSILFVNGEEVNRYEAEPHTVLGKSWFQSWPRVDRSLAREQFAAARSGGIGRFRSSTVGLKGNVRWWDVAITPMSDPDGNFFRLLIVSRDVTGQKEAEEKLQKKENFFRSLVENAHDLVTVMRYDATILYESPACERTLGFRVDEKLGKNCLDYIHPNDQKRVTRELSELVRGKYDIKTLEYSYLHKSGNFVPLEVIARLSVDENGDPIVIVNKRDISERRQKEGQLRKLVARLLNVQDEERRRFARELHDETAQNLALLDINFAAIEKAVEEGSDDIVETLSQSRALIAQTLREVRTISYLLHPPMLDEAGLQTALSWLIRGFSQRSGIQVKVECTTGGDRFSSEIEIAIYRVVQEALTNIHRHSGSKTAQVGLRPKGDSLVLTIEDQGCGIPDSVIDKRAGGVESLGVGIPGMRERLHLLGGRLDVRSDATGTSLMAVFPLKAK